MTFQEWQNQGNYQKISDRNIFVIDVGDHQETLVILHGYPTFSYDYWKVLPILSRSFRVVIHDHLGFGLSDKPKNYSYSLIEQADIALQLWQKLGLKKVHLWAHDYGTSVATELIARQNKGWLPIQLQSVTLGNGSMRIEMAQLRPIQRLLIHKQLGPIVANLSSEQVFVRNMKKIWGDSALVDPQEMTTMWKMLLYNNGREVLPQVSLYIRERYRFWHRWIGALRNTEQHINYFWATQDPVAIKDMATVLHQETPNSSLKWLDRAGHYPMLEKPEEWANGLLELIFSDD